MVYLDVASRSKEYLLFAFAAFDNLNGYGRQY